jgi:DNA-binding NarL/FixJ family response regulator
MLNSEEGIQVVGEAATDEESIRQAILLSPDVILMNIKMLGMNGIDATREIKQQMPHVDILMLTLQDGVVIPLPKVGKWLIIGT